MAGFSWPFRSGKRTEAAEALLAAVADAARQQAFHGEGGVPDTLEGRLEMLMLHGALALVRLRKEPSARQLAQDFTDLFFRHIDAGLREDGVGDLSVPRRMRAIAGKFYGRLEAYEAALPNAAALAEALARNARPASPGFAAWLAGYVRATAAHQAELAPTALASADGWRPASGSLA